MCSDKRPIYQLAQSLISNRSIARQVSQCHKLRINAPHAPCEMPLPSSYCACFFSHSSGVKHFGVHACMAAISVFRAELTSRCRARLFFFSKSGDTIIAWNAWPQPPMVSVLAIEDASQNDMIT